MALFDEGLGPAVLPRSSTIGGQVLFRRRWSGVTGTLPSGRLPPVGRPVLRSRSAGSGSAAPTQRPVQRGGGRQGRNGRAGDSVVEPWSGGEPHPRGGPTPPTTGRGSHAKNRSYRWHFGAVPRPGWSGFCLRSVTGGWSQ